MFSISSLQLFQDMPFPCQEKTAKAEGQTAEEAEWMKDFKDEKELLKIASQFLEEAEKDFHAKSLRDEELVSIYTNAKKNYQGALDFILSAEGEAEAQQKMGLIDLRLYQIVLQKKMGYFLTSQESGDITIVNQLKERKFDLIEACLNEKKSSLNEWELFSKAIILEEKGKLNEASRAFAKLGKFLFDKELDELAYKSIDRAIQLNPKDPFPNYLMSRLYAFRADKMIHLGEFGCLASLRDYEKSIEYLDKIRLHCSHSNRKLEVEQEIRKISNLIKLLRRHEIIIDKYFKETLKSIASIPTESAKLFTVKVWGEGCKNEWSHRLLSHLMLAGIRIEKTLEVTCRNRFNNEIKSTMQAGKQISIIEDSHAFLFQADLESKTPLSLLMNEKKSNNAKSIVCNYRSVLSYFPQTLSLVQNALELKESKRFSEISFAFCTNIKNSFHSIFYEGEEAIYSLKEGPQQSLLCRLLPEGWPLEEWQKELEFIKKVSVNFDFIEVYKDGNCGLRSIVKSLHPHLDASLLSEEEEEKIDELRKKMVQFIRDNKKEFLSFFITDPARQDADFEGCLKDMSLSENYVDQPELCAISHVLQRPIWIFRRGSTIEGEGGEVLPAAELRFGSHFTSKPIFLYHRPEHYMKLKKKLPI